MRFAGLLNWRWTPAFALVGGSLLFVLLAIVVVPDHLGAGSMAPASPKGSASSRGLFGRPAPSASAHSAAAPEPATATTGTSTAERARERRALRERRPPHAPGSPGSYQNGPIDRMFGGGNPPLTPPVGDPPPPAEPAAVPAPTLPPPPAAPAPGDAPVPAAPQ